MLFGLNLFLKHLKRAPTHEIHDTLSVLRLFFQPFIL